MKKLIYVCSVLTLIFTSCSKDSADSELLAPTNGTLVKKIVDTDPSGSVKTTMYTYNGNKVVSAINNTSDEDLYFTYTGDNITKIEYKFNDGSLNQTDSYTYDSNGKVIGFVTTLPNTNFGFKEIYSYNTDGTISINYYSGDTVTQTSPNGTGTIYFTNGEVSKIERYNGTTLQEIKTYTYDTKNNLMKSVVGYSKINLTFPTGINHNLATEYSSSYGLWSYSFVYQANDFPSSSSIAHGTVGPSTSQFFY